MSRIARVVAVGYPHHITQRGNYRQKVFLDDNDRKTYLTFIQEYSHKFKLSILAYCMMSNHVHFVGIPEEDKSLARTFNCAHMRYSQYFNKKIGAGGHLWQGRFYSCVLDEQHLMITARYVERNPVRAKLKKRPWQWNWSSASVHIGTVKASVIELKDLFEYIDIPREEWQEYIDEEDERKDIKEIKSHTLTGRPLGTESFIEKLERKFGKRLHALSVGRPRKVAK